VFSDMHDYTAENLIGYSRPMLEARLALATSLLAEAVDLLIAWNESPNWKDSGYDDMPTRAFLAKIGYPDKGHFENTHQK